MMKRNNDSKISTNPYFDVVKIKTETNFGVLKTFVVAIFILLQFVFILFTWHYLFNLFTWLLVASYALTLCFCLIILSTKRTGQVKAIWILFMLLCPTFGWLIFLLSNERVMFAKNKRKYKKIFERTKQNNNILLKNQSINECVQRDCYYLQKSGNFGAYYNVNSQYYSNGAELFDNIIQALKDAKKFIFIEYFIIADGVLLNRITEVLKQKAKNNVDVRIIYDDMGSHGTLSRKIKKELKNAGIKVVSFNKLVPVFNLALNLRDHRKIVVVDGVVSFTGGANLADEYINEKRTHGYWKDCGIKVCGNATDTFTLAFLRQWEFITGKKQEVEQFLNQTNIAGQEADGGEVLVPYITGPDYSDKIARDVYENIIASANQKIYIMTPYFIPDETLFNLLKNKAKSGVDVHIVLPEVADKKSVYLITLDGAEMLIDCGVKVHLMKNSFVHSKVVLTENSAVIGSINMDQRSFYQQFESAVYTNNKEIMQSVQQDFEQTFERSKIHIRKPKNLILRLITYVLRLISPLM